MGLEPHAEDDVAFARSYLRDCDVEVETKTAHGDLADEILEEVKAEAYDLIVVGTRDLGPIGRAALGSVSHKITAHAPCPVVVAAKKMQPSGSSRWRSLGSRTLGERGPPAASGRLSSHNALSMERRLISSGSPYEPVVGFSRAVRVGPHVHVAGTGPVMPDGAPPPAGAYGQAKRCFEIIVAALLEAGAEAEHVVRTRHFATSAEVFDDLARAHGELFAEIRPASTFVVVSSFVDPRWLVEIEADAIVHD